jgi:hypothetical protein
MIQNSFLQKDSIGFVPPVERSPSWDADALYLTKPAKTGIIGICVQFINELCWENLITREIRLFADAIQLLITEHHEQNNNFRTTT